MELEYIRDNRIEDTLKTYLLQKRFDDSIFLSDLCQKILAFTE